MTVWTRRGRLVCGRNLVLVVLLCAALLFTASSEGYLQGFTLPFELLLGGGLALSLWMAVRASTRRFLALLLSVFFVEYAQETIGIRSGLWVYHGDDGRYLFGVLAWVLGGTAAFVFAIGVTIPLLCRIRRRLPRWLNLAFPPFFFVLIAVTVDPCPSGTGVPFWSFYAAMLALALVAAQRMPWQVLAGLVVSAWVVGNASEYLGSTVSGFWTFPDHPNYPPFYLLAGCWPLEILVQYSLSAILAGEPLNAGLSDKPAPPTPGQMAAAPRQLRALLIVSGIAYLFVGFAFALIPDPILRAVNALSRVLTPCLPPAGLPRERFWVALAFSMMMTISALCFLAALNLRRHKGYVVPLLVAKAASTLSSLVYFAASTHQLASLVIFLVDGTLFCVTLYFFVRAQRAFFLAQTGYLYGDAPPPPSSGPTTVAAIRGEDKYACLELVLAATNFFEILESERKRVGKSPATFRVVIKPNFMFMHALKDKSTYTDPELVEALIDRIAAKGYPNIAVVEAQSTYGNYYLNRDVLTVAEHVGYHRDRNYKIVDLTKEKVDHHPYGGRLGDHPVGPTWRDADFRISFAKNKTHVFCYYTLTLKNVYGAFPPQDKLEEYHTKREYDWPTIDALRTLPVHFGLIDAFTSADGQFGVIADPRPNPTQTIIGGENLRAVDWVGAKKMGLDPDDPLVGRFLPLANQAFGKPEVHWIGDQSVYPSWDNVSPFFIYALDLIEEAYDFSNWWFSVLTAMDEKFPFAKRDWPTLAMRKLLAPVKRLLYPHDVL
jgi:uncharacterized protein (DUF362 family)